MRLIIVFSLLILAQAAFAKSNAPAKKRELASAEMCQAPLKELRAFVIVGLANIGDSDSGIDLRAPNGETSEYIWCPNKIFSTVDVGEDGRGHRVNFSFANTAACNEALAKFKTATKDIPAVVVVDKDCSLHVLN